MHRKRFHIDHNILCYCKELIPARGDTLGIAVGLSFTCIRRIVYLSRICEQRRYDKRRSISVKRAKYRAAQQDRIENLRDEERQEFNVKLEKTKELSRDTNRRRRALEQRRKNYEAEEEKKRREILAQRKKEIQEATEKFQRANFVRSKKKSNHNNHPDRSKPNQKLKHDKVGLGLRTKNVKTDVNGQQYYPSVEEVLSMLHADHTNVIERLVSGETNDRLLPRDYSYSPVQDENLTGSSAQDQFPASYLATSEGTKPSPESVEQRIFDQEKLRSEVVGRSQPKFAFGDETKDITEGVLPTTMRRNSPSGSLSSLDSLDEVPDEVLETTGSEPVRDVTDSAVEGIIRKANRVGRGNRVTFNENVIFSDGLVGMLKRKVDMDANFGDPRMERQKSYFEFPTEEANHEKPNKGAPGNEPLRPVDNRTKDESLNYSQGIPASSYPSSTSISGSGATSVNNNHSLTSPVAVTSSRFTSQSRTNGVVQQGLHAPTNNTPPAHPVKLPKGQNSIPRDTGGKHHDSSNVYHGVRKPSLISKNDKGEIARRTQSSTTSGYKVTRTNPGANTGKNYCEVDGFRLDYQDQSGSNEDRKTFATSNTRLPSSSINASMLRDSLEINHEIIVSLPESRTQVEYGTHTPPGESHVRSAVLNHAPANTDVEGTPETPLIPVTKKDFLSKALKRTSNNSISSPGDMNSMVTFDCSEQQESVMPSHKRTDELGNGYRSSSSVVSNPSDATKRGGYESNVYKQGCEYIAGNMGGTQELSGISRNNFSTMASRSHQVPRAVNNKPFSMSENSPIQQSKGSPACNGTAMENFSDQENIGTQTGHSAEDLLRNVKEDIQKISMSSGQQNFSQTYGSTVNQGGIPAVDSDSHSKSTSSDRGRRPPRKKGMSRQKLKSKEGNTLNSTAKRLHRPAHELEPGNRKQISSKINIEYSSNQSDIQQYLRPNSAVTSAHNRSPAYENGSRLRRAEIKITDSESRPIKPYSHNESTWASTFERKQLQNSGLTLLDKTPTDEEINTLWETVRTCLKHEQSQKAASDSVVNNVRHSGSARGPLIDNHYLIDCNRWDYKPQIRMNAFGLNSPGSDPRQGTTSSYLPFRRQNSLDSFERRRSYESTASLPQRKGPLLEHRSHKTERRLTRTQQSSRSPLNSHYFQALRGPITSSRGPQKSNFLKDNAKRPQLSYAEFKAVMQASADHQMRNGEGEIEARQQQALHQPIIMNQRKDPSALSLEEKRLLESLDRLNERLKVQEAATANLTKGERNPSIPGKKTMMGNSSKLSTNNNRFSGQSRQKGLTSPSLLNRR